MSIAGAQNLTSARIIVNAQSGTSGAALAHITLTFTAGSASFVLAGVRADLLAAARNDERAVTYPAAASDVLDEDAAATLTTLLVPHLRLLTRRRVLAAETVLTFPS